jgi:hypothetical protein
MEPNTKPPEVLGAISLEEGKDAQIKEILWAAGVTADLLPNTTDLRFPYKASSLICPFCGSPLTGTPIEPEQPEPEASNKDDKFRKKRKPKPWEIRVEDLRHEKEGESPCPLSTYQNKPGFRLAVLLALCHQKTWMATQSGGLNQPDQFTPKSEEPDESITGDGRLPKLILNPSQEEPEDPQDSGDSEDSGESAQESYSLN